MLTIFKQGIRDYAAKPSVVRNPRPMWEFQAVVHGEIARINPQSPEKMIFHSNSLWLSPPGSTHGWKGRPGAPAEVVVFHTRHLPELLRERVKQQEFTRITLDEQALHQVIYLAERTARHWQKPSIGMLLFSDAVVSELSCLIFEKIASNRSCIVDTGAAQVNRAMEIYGERMRWNPSLKSVAKEVGVSVAHLRRLFHQHMGKSPKAIFGQMRERRIIQLLTDSNYSLEAIAEETGFSESSALSRAFKARLGYAPSTIRI